MCFSSSKEGNESQIFQKKSFLKKKEMSDLSIETAMLTGLKS